jgi:uncharacterized phiE125 gp8 family phage protein
MDWRSLTRVSGPVLEPVLPESLYDHLRLVEDDTEKSYADAVSHAAREWVEARNGIATLTQTWDIVFDGWWEGPLDLPYPPLQSVSYVRYLDTNGATQTLNPSSYVVLPGSPVAQIIWAPNASRPNLLERVGNVTIRMVTGYTSPAQVPATVRQAILILASTWFEHREAVGANTNFQRVPFTVNALLDQTRVRWW